MKVIKIFFVLLATGLLLSACKDEAAFVPKPRGFHRIELPPHEYRKLAGDYPYEFELSSHARILRDTSFMTEPYWIDIVYPGLDATLSLAYKPVQGNVDSLAEMTNDSHRLTNKHYARATAIEEFVMRTPMGHTAIVFELEGEVPSYFQYYLTDSARHFLRVALYFPTSTRADSLAPVIEYVKKDMAHMINTTDWKEGFYN